MPNTAMLPYSSAALPQGVITAIRRTAYSLRTGRRMIITLASFKGGVAKSTTAIHLARYSKSQLPRSSWITTRRIDRHKVVSTRNGEGLKFRVIDHFLLGREGRNYTHIVIDTKAAPGKEDLENLVRGSDLLIIPCFRNHGARHDG